MKKNTSTDIDYTPNTFMVVANTVVVIGAYTLVCRIFGYRMVKPYQIKDGVVLVKTVGGKLLQAKFPS